MSQKRAWEREYDRALLVSKSNEPAQDVKNFARFLRKETEFKIDESKLIDLGCGVGKNAAYFSELGSHVVGIDIAKNAVDDAKKYAEEHNLSIEYRVQDLAEPLPYPDQYFDYALDVLTTNSLTEEERERSIHELNRVLRPGGYFLLKALCKDGDKNAQTLLKENPWKERDTYFMEDLGIHERVFSSSDIERTYSPYFEILRKIKKTNYPRVNGRIYKRNFWILYMRKIGA